MGVDGWVPANPGFKLHALLLQNLFTVAGLAREIDGLVMPAGKTRSIPSNAHFIKDHVATLAGSFPNMSKGDVEHSRVA